MKGLDIRVSAQIYVSMEISKTYALRYLNEGLEILAEGFDTACIKDNIIIVALKDTWISLPEDFLKSLEVQKDNYIIEDYEVRNGEIRFKEDGTFKIDYLRYPKDLANENEEPELHKGYHKALAYFVASRHINRLFGSENPEATRLMRDFINQAEMLHNKLSNQKRSRKIKVPSFTMGW